MIALPSVFRRKQPEVLPAVAAFDDLFDDVLEECEKRDFRDLNLLTHAVLKRHPNADTVNLLLDKVTLHTQNDVPEQALDCERKNPLHVAMIHLTLPEITQRLLSGPGGCVPACMKDEFRRLPLHYVCDQRNVSIENREALFQNICLVLNAYPMAVAITDKFGDTPYSLAIQNQLDKDIIHVLSHTYHLFASKILTSERQKLESDESVSIDRTVSSSEDSNDDSCLPLEITVLGDIEEDSSAKHRSKALPSLSGHFRKQLRKTKRSNSSDTLEGEVRREPSVCGTTHQKSDLCDAMIEKLFFI